MKVGSSIGSKKKGAFTIQVIWEITNVYLHNAFLLR